MRLLWSGLSGWAGMKAHGNEALRSVDLGITVLATLLVITTWTMVR